MRACLRACERLCVCVDSTVRKFLLSILECLHKYVKNTFFKCINKYYIEINIVYEQSA